MRVSSYLELNWLAKSDKYILLPPVIFADIEHGGYFLLPKKKEVLIGNEYYPADKGLIVINDAVWDGVESAIAHEWRHLWQYYQGWKVASTWHLKSKYLYKQKIINFFTTYPSEYDALLFQLKKAPDDTALEWHEWIIKR